MFGLHDRYSRTSRNSRMPAIQNGKSPRKGNNRSERSLIDAGPPSKTETETKHVYVKVRKTKAFSELQIDN